jgi:hypothetical protein
MSIPTTRARAKKRLTRRRTRASAEESRLFKHILVPIDLSDRNERILRLAVGLARIKQSRVTLLHVIQAIAGIAAGAAQLLQETRAAVTAHARTSGQTIRRRRGHRPSRHCHRGSRPRDHQGDDGATGNAHCDGLPPCDAETSWPRLGHHQLQGRNRLSVSDSPGEVNEVDGLRCPHAVSRRIP